MSEKLKAKKTKATKKATRAKASSASSSSQGVKSKKKKTSRKSTMSRSKKTAKSTAPVTEEQQGLPPELTQGHPPLEEMFAQAADSAVDHTVVDLPVETDGKRPAADDSKLEIRLSRSLLRKIKDQALDEGLPLEEFVAELLSESVVLRAWEIVERKNQMRQSGGSSQGSQNRSSAHGNSHYQNQNHHGNQHHGRQHHRKNRGMNHGRYQSIMDDKASFIEYVRNQERSQR
jgi:hypothetical protein